MNHSEKWFIRVGSIFIVLGFVLPALTVSCSGAPGLGQSISLLDLSGQADKPALFLIPIGAIVALVLSLLYANNQSTAVRFLWGQVAGLAIGFLALVSTLISVNNQVKSMYVFEVKPQFGIFMLVVGYVAAAIGVVLQWREVNRHEPAISPPVSSPPFQINQPNNPFVPPGSKGARLQTIQGNVPQSIIPIVSDNFMIGRASENDLQLHDMKVSRQHACLRFAQGGWFIQDRESSIGTLVNGQSIQAIRLNSGDKITIGEEMFIFYE